MDYNFWYYTLSAIPQVLAAIIGFFAVFVVYKQTRIHELIDEKKQDVHYFLLILHPNKEIHDLEKLKEDDFCDLLKSGIEKLNPQKDNLDFDGYDRLRDLMQVIIVSWRRHYSADANRIYNFLVGRQIALKKLINDKKEVYKYFNRVICLGSASILFPLILLPFGTKIINNSECLTWEVIYLVVFLGVASVCCSMYSAWKITKL